MEWWAIWLLFFGIFFGCGRMCGWHRHDREEKLERMRNRHRHRLNRSESDIYIGSGMSGDRSGEPDRAVTKKPRPQGSRLERLQRDFVEGRISMDEYERRLDTLEHI